MLLSLPVAAALFPLAQAAAPVPAMTFQDVVNKLQQQFQGSLNQLIIFGVASQLVLIIAYWLASKPVADEEWSGFGSALKVYFLHLLVGVGLTAAMIFGFLYMRSAYATFQSAHSYGAGGIVLGVGVLALIVILFSIYFAFSIPMSVYRIGFGGALAFFLMTGLVAGPGTWGLTKALGNPVVVKTTVMPNPLDVAEAKAADRTKTIAERQSALKEIYDRLETQRTTMPTGDLEARGEYQRRLAKYEKLLNDLRAEVAEHRGGS